MRKYFGIFVSIFFLGIDVCHAQKDNRVEIYLKARQEGTQTKPLDELFPEWQLTKTYNLCMMISNRVKDNNPTGGFKFLYQRRIYDAAKVDTTKDSPEMIAKKISAMWTVAEQLNLLVCSSGQFDVTKGNLLKFAVSYKFDEFIADILKWKIPLNRVDASDDRTVLDYIQFHLIRNKGNALEPIFQEYYNRFRAAGAKHKVEL